MNTWDQSFLRLASFWTNERSKDPSTKVGAVLVSPDRTEVVLGYNGFPPGIADDPALLADRDAKYARVIHAEANAILNARRDLTGWTCYVTLLPCSGACGGHNCAGLVIRAGIKRVVIPAGLMDLPRWKDSWAVALAMFAEAGVAVEEIVV
jgi:dCMP deaminase